MKKFSLAVIMMLLSFNVFASETYEDRLRNCYKAKSDYMYDQISSPMAFESCEVKIMSFIRSCMNEGGVEGTQVACELKSKKIIHDALTRTE
ncbi:MAG: hypothetical protein NTZ45_08910 [Methylococcales bacterium]|jgi:hypothetical protein|nr:hypothetical protein [Methylococcales bacterium]